MAMPSSSTTSSHQVLALQNDEGAQHNIIQDPEDPQSPIPVQPETVLNLPEVVASNGLVQMPPGSPPRVMNGADVLQIYADDPTDNLVETDFAIASDFGDQGPYFPLGANRAGDDIEATLLDEQPAAVDLGEGIVVGDLSPLDYVKTLSLVPSCFERHE